jgi:hypothetical protein
VHTAGAQSRLTSRASVAHDALNACVYGLQRESGERVSNPRPQAWEALSRIALKGRKPAWTQGIPALRRFWHMGAYWGVWG